MKEKLAAWLPIGVFLCLLAAISAWNLLRPIRVFSENENRTLAQFPELSVETLLNGDFSEQYEKYLADPQRENRYREGDCQQHCIQEI